MTELKWKTIDQNGKEHNLKGRIKNYQLDVEEGQFLNGVITVTEVEEIFNNPLDQLRVGVRAWLNDWYTWIPDLGDINIYKEKLEKLLEG